MSDAYTVLDCVMVASALPVRHTKLLERQDMGVGHQQTWCYDAGDAQGGLSGSDGPSTECYDQTMKVGRFELGRMTGEVATAMNAERSCSELR